ncbi:phosphotransferase enzyme family protein [Hamadaea tsunoensis]|uniref:phosphotransferase enzyme family protein n=1 Tax=Hamadaea tsunoensis TaxID=53368 RepID=UPI00041BDF5B|nr:phosphotransferase [Hamadaea tsunoensis]
MTDLFTWVHQDFGIELAGAEELDEGADPRATLWRATAVGGERYAIKLTSGGTPAALVLAAHLRARGVAGVPAPVAARDGKLFTMREGRRLSVVPWVGTGRAVTTGLDAGQWRALGVLFRRVHAAPPLDGLPCERHDPAPLLETFQRMDEHIRGCTSADPLARSLRHLWYAYAADLETLVTRTARLGAALGRREAPAVVCHNDAHLGNILTAPGRVWLIDWDDAVLAPPERDLLFVVDGIFSSAPVTAAQQAAFFAGYGEISVDPERLTYYRCTRALEDLDWALNVLDVEGRRPDDRTEALEIIEGLLSPTGLVALALRPPVLTATRHG